MTLTARTTGRLIRPGDRDLPRHASGQVLSLRLLLPLLLFGLLAMTSTWSWRWLGPALDRLDSQASAAPEPPSAAPHAGPPLAPVFTPTVTRWAADIDRWSRQADLDLNLVAVVMQLESCGDPLARSPAGALGLFQVMPYHFAPSEDPLDPDTNARRGLAYLAGGLELADGNTALALAGYNGGHGIIPAAADSWPLETRRYVDWGAGLLADIANHRMPSPTLDRWLQAGGAWLCRAADSPQALTSR